MSGEPEDVLAEMQAGPPPDRPYARCKGCELTFADRDSASAHSRATMVPTGELGVTHRGHGYVVENPTDEEIAAMRVRGEISSALDDLCEALGRCIARGDFTAEQAKKEMVWFDLADVWDEWAREEED